MKKYLLISLLVLSFSFTQLAKAAGTSLFFLMNGDGYDISGSLKAFCLLDGNCYDIQGNPLNSTSTPFTSIPAISMPIINQIQNVPPVTIITQTPPSNNPIPSIPNAEGESQNPITLVPDPSFTATSVPISGTQVTLGQWVVTNNTNVPYSQLISYLTFNFIGKLGQTEGFNNLAINVNGEFCSPSKLIGVNLINLLACGIFPNQTETFKVIGDPIFSSSTNVSAIRIDMGIGLFDGPSLSAVASSSLLSLVP